MTNSLGVWYEERRVGRLVVTPDRKMAFCYDGDWLTRDWPISCSLPVNETGDFLPPDMRGHHFFANLLPEGGARERLVRQLGISDDDFLLLERLGGDCAGALQLLPESLRPDTSVAAERVLDEASLLEAIETGRAHWLSDAQQTPRLSLAGAQDKIALKATREDGKWAFSIPLNNAPSTHILKLPVRDLKQVPLLEAYTTFIAQQLGLPVAPVQLTRIGSHHVSLSCRYDREERSGRLQRRHQEDFCQAMGLSHIGKYDGSAGAFTRIGNVIRQHCDKPAADLQTLAKWQIFNALAGNADAHLKNLSLLATDQGGWQLAPFYDLVCTLAIAPVSHLMALPVGGKADPRNLHRRHWEQFANELGIRPHLVKRLVCEQAEPLKQHIDDWHGRFTEQYGLNHELDTARHILKKQASGALRNWVD